MEKNKSIDGLSTRRSKKPATSSQKPKASPKTVVKNTTVVKKPVNKKPKIVETPRTPENPETPTIDPTEDFLSPVQAFDFDEATGSLKASEKPLNKSTQKTQESNKKEKKPVSKKRKIITTIVLIIVLLLIGGITWLVLWGNDIIAKITGGQGNLLDLIKFTEPTYEPLKTDANGRTNILAFGTSGYNMDGDEGNGVHDGAQLTDSIMMISLNQETGDVAMLSLPRDLKASPTCTATGKINEIYWCNGGKGGASTAEEATAANALMDEVSSILGVDFQYFAHLNWGSLVQIVDTLGGIKVTLDEGIYDYYYTGMVLDPGVEYTLTGIEAVALSRARHGTTGGDFSRGASQQKILIGIKDKLLEKDLSITDYLSLASALGDNLRTNFSLDEIKSLAHLTFDLDFDNMRQLTLYDPNNWSNNMMSTANINGISYVVPKAGVGNYSTIQKYVVTMLSNDPRVYEEPSILVLNATDEPGLASAEKSKLEEEGYQNVTADNAPEGEYEPNTTIYAINNEKLGSKDLLEKSYNQTAKTLSDLPSGVSQDYDFVIIINPVTEENNE